MLNAEAVDRITELAAGAVEEHDENLYYVNSKGAALLKYPAREVVKCFSLTQLVNLAKLHADDEAAGAMTVNVVSHDEVSLAYDAVNGDKTIDTIGEADFSKMFDSFSFGKNMNQNDFVIQLLTKFEMDDTLKALIKTVSSVKAEKVSTSEDDGISQTASMKAGVHLTDTQPVKNMWNLKTFKTFPEVNQPVIPYILRLHQINDTSLPQFALYECDGGKWKVNLTIQVRDWLVNRTKSVLGPKADKLTIL